MYSRKTRGTSKCKKKNIDRITTDKVTPVCRFASMAPQTSIHETNAPFLDPNIFINDDNIHANSFNFRISFIEWRCSFM